MNRQSLGRLERVELRDVWSNEATDFTPWLAQPENLKVLEETLGIDLEVEAIEKPVGPFSADILCKDLGTNRSVLIENQLERTDHRHLGQLLTYAAGLQAVTVIWIAARFTEEHRAALDWLNEITEESLCFLGLEVEVWRIGGSPAAPRFNIISKPNEWSRSVKNAPADPSRSRLHATHRNYWAAFHEVLNRVGGPVSGNRKPQPQSWMGYRVGRSGVSLFASRQPRKQRVCASLYLSGEKANAFFAGLKQDKDSIESELGWPLDWREMPKEREIVTYLNSVDPDNESDWPQQHEWLAERINAMHAVFSPRIKNLNTDDLEEGEP